VPCNERVYLHFVCARPGRLIAEVERHTYFSLPVTSAQNQITQTMLHQVEWTATGIKPRTFPLQGEQSTDWANQPASLLNFDKQVINNRGYRKEFIKNE